MEVQGKVLLSLGLVRGLIAGILGAGISIAALMALRAGLGLPAWEPGLVSATGAIVGTLAHLVGLGALSDWWRWARGDPMPEPGAHLRPTWARYLSFDTNHKVIGVQYTVASLLLMLVAGLLALLMRLELTRSGIQLIDAPTYNTLMSLHGIVMIAAILVGVAGPTNYLIPLMIGARDMAFPRLNAFSFWLVPPATVLVLLTLVTGGFDTGWTAYPPLSARAPLGMQFFFLGVYLVGLSSILGAINFLSTILTMRAPGMGLFHMPIFVWAILATSLISLTATQFIAMSFLMVVLERILGMGFFDPAKGGSVVLFQHLFWFYSHPAVYVFVLPGLGIISELLPVFARKPLFGYRAVALSSMAIAILGFFVWGHHMFAAGMEDVLHTPFMFATLLVAVPTGVKIFSWLATLWEGKLSFETPMLFVLGALVIFLIGGLTGPPNALPAADIYLHDTYWVVGHFHHTIFGGFLFPFLAAIYFWFPKVTGRRYHEGLGKLHFWLMFVGFFVTTSTMFRLGLLGFRRRIADYDAALGWEPLNVLATLGGFLVAAGILVLVVNLVSSALRGVPAPANLWRSRSLEWQLPSPPPEENYPIPPRVVGRPYDYGVPGALYAVMGVSGGSDSDRREPSG